MVRRPVVGPGLSEVVPHLAADHVERLRRPLHDVERVEAADRLRRSLLHHVVDPPGSVEPGIWRVAAARCHVELCGEGHRSGSGAVLVPGVPVEAETRKAEVWTLRCSGSSGTHGKLVITPAVAE